MWWIVLLVAAVLATVTFLRARAAKSLTRTAPTHDPNAKKEHFLTARNGPEPGKSWHIGARRVTIGREPTNYVQLNVPGVSRIACQIDSKGDSVRVIDMGSRSGTSVNGEPVRDAELKEGDVLALAGVEFVYTREGDVKNNAAFDGKVVSKEVHATTVDGRDNLALRAMATLALHEGDEAKAAEETGVTVEQFRELLEENDKEGG